MNTRMRDVYGLPTGAHPDQPQPPHLVALPGARVGQAQWEDDRKGREGREEPLPLPKWLLVLYFAFPVVLYVPDGLFNYFVYSDGVSNPNTGNPVLDISQVMLWGFLSIGIVGMAYLLSMLAPWHWMHGHHVQAFFCGIGVVIATAVTIWNSLAYRSQAFHPFATDQWVYSIWPQLQEQHISLTMIFAAVAPPFWGLFWAIVQPTQTRRNLAHLQENHAERVMRLQQEAEMKTLRAEASARIRAAQLKGMAQTATAAREQAGVVAAQWRHGKKPDGRGDGQTPATRSASADGVPAADEAVQQEVQQEVQQAPDSGIRLRPLPQDYTLPGSVAPRPQAGASPRAAAPPMAPPMAPGLSAASAVGAPAPDVRSRRGSSPRGRDAAAQGEVSAEPAVADPVGAMGYEPPHITNPSDALAASSPRRRH